MILTEKDNGGVFCIKIGSLLTVNLEENPTTGYRWDVENANSYQPIEDKYERSKKAIGAAGLRTFIFLISSIGSHEIEMKKWRKWEGDKSVVERFYVRIETL